MDNKLFIKNLQMLLVESQVDNAATLELARVMREKIKEIGVVRFIEEIAMPFGCLVNESWEHNQLNAFVSHSYKIQMIQLLSEVILTKRKNVYKKHESKVLVSGFQGEKQVLGSFVIEASLCEIGAFCINLGSNVPVQEIVNAAKYYEANIVALSVSRTFNKRLAMSLIRETRTKLPTDIEIWIVGSEVDYVDGFDYVKKLDKVSDCLTAYNETKKQHV